MLHAKRTKESPKQIWTGHFIFIEFGNLALNHEPWIILLYLKIPNEWIKSSLCVFQTLKSCGFKPNKYGLLPNHQIVLIKKKVSIGNQSLNFTFQPLFLHNALLITTSALISISRFHNLVFLFTADTNNCSLTSEECRGPSKFIKQVLFNINFILKQPYSKSTWVFFIYK